MLAATRVHCALSFFFFNDTATTEIYTLSLHDALPISSRRPARTWTSSPKDHVTYGSADRKSTRLNSSHANISYAVFCLKKKTEYELGHYLVLRLPLDTLRRNGALCR